MAFDEDVNLRVTADTPATEQLREVGRAASDAQDEVDRLDASSATVDVDAPELPSVQRAVEEIHAEFDALDNESVTVDVSAPGLDDIEGSAGRARAGLDGVSNAGDRTGSVMANVAGNAAQDLANVAGAGGTAGIALGQIAEYASEGGISLAKFGPAAGGIALAGVALGQVNAALEHQAEIKAWDTARVDAYVESLRAGRSELEAITEELLRTEEIKLTVFGDDKLGPDDAFQIDIVPLLAQAGQTVDDFAQHVGDSKEEARLWKEELRDAGLSAQEAGFVIAAAAQEAERLGVSHEKSADKVAVFDQRTKEATRTMQAAQAAAHQYAVALNEVLTNLAALVNAGPPGAPFSTSRAGRGETVINNFIAPPPSPTDVERAIEEWQRTQIGPNG